nr:hypothetical protein [Tanacetum cinerariifolium]
NRPLLATPRLWCEVEESSATAARRPWLIESAADDLVVQHIMRTQALEAEHAMTPWRTLVAVPRFGYDCSYYAVC